MSISNLLSNNEYDLFCGNINASKEIRSNIIRADFLRLNNLPMLVRENSLYINPINGEISYGPVSGGNVVLDPFITGNIKCNNLHVNNISGNLVSNVNILGNVFMPNIRPLTSGNVVYYNNVSRELTFGPSVVNDPLITGNIRCNNLHVNNISGNLVSNVNILGNVFMPNIRPLTSGNVVYYNNVSRELTFGTITASPPLESGLSYVNTTATVILNIPTTVAIIPIFYAVSPTITHTLNWNSADWALGTGTQNRFVYTGTSKKFYMEVDLAIGTGASSATINLALYKNGSALPNSGIAQTQQVFGALIPTVETMSFIFPFTAVSGDFFELYIYGSSTGLNIQPITASLFSPSTLCPSIAVEIQQVNI
jgi:hypothetical protein